MLSYLAAFESEFGPFRLFQYITFRAMMAGITALVVGYWIAPAIIRKLRDFKQPVRTKEEIGEEMAQKHAGKGNTPTMGGIIILVSLVFSVLLWAKPFQEVRYIDHQCANESCGETFRLSSIQDKCPSCGHEPKATVSMFALETLEEGSSGGQSGMGMRQSDEQLNSYVLTALVVFIGLSIVGFLDDYLKVSKKNSKGLPGKYKIVGQTLVTLVSLYILTSSHLSSGNMREIWIPFYRHVLVDSAPVWAIGVLLFFVLVGSSNAINLTDGLDGLATGCTVTVALAYGVMAYIVGNYVLSESLLVKQVLGVGELSIVCTALLGSCMAFLWYNCSPADVFMGDTGSLALGGLVGIIAFMVQQPFTLVIVGGIFVLEAVSVILQVSHFKSTGRRIFKMAPIHHHFEKCGWAETKVVIRFWIISLICSIAGLATLKIR
jgi:phospho-N-acetylmuramoyl-pentapeptide-transferase